MFRLSVFAAVAVLLVLAGPAQAHPADSLALSFDDTLHTLTVQVFHTVKNAQEHYISKIVVNLNDREMVVQKFLTQTDSEGQSVAYILIDAQPGDRLAVSATCSLFGKAGATLEVPANPGE